MRGKLIHIFILLLPEGAPAGQSFDREGITMIKELARLGLSAADRLILRDALNTHYESVIASNGSDVTNDVSVLPNALVWIYDLEQAVVVVAVRRQAMDTEYLAEVSIRPYTLDAAGRRIMCDPLPEDDNRCQAAAHEAALALAVHVAERRLGAASDRPAEPRTFDYTKGIPQQGDLSLLTAVRERVSGKREATERQDSITPDNSASDNANNYCNTNPDPLVHASRRSSER
jgi:hypothetical protein